MSLIIVLIIAVSLSMDAFSLSLAYGTLNVNKKMMYILSIMVGVFHFFMPLLGYSVGNFILNVIPISPNIIVFLVLTFIGIEMLLETFKDESDIKLINFKASILFAFAVSLDSFSVGIGIKTIYSSPILCSLIFSVSSFIFTYMGLYLGKKISSIIGRISTLFGGLTLIILGSFYLI